MKKETSLNEKIKAYTAMAAGILAASQGAEAQNIIYTDIVPDTMISNSLYSLDLNNDGTTDFRIGHATHSSGRGVGILHLSSNQNQFASRLDYWNVGSINYPLISPDTLNTGNPINNSLNWKPDIVGTTSASSFLLAIDKTAPPIVGGNWLHTGEHYIGLLLNGGATYNYGWARIVVDDALHNFVIKDYAYNTNDNEPLLAGQGIPSGIKNVQQENGKLYTVTSHGKKITVNILSNEMKGGKIELLNLQGELVFTAKIETSQIVLNEPLLATGMYFLRVITDSHFQTEKIVME